MLLFLHGLLFTQAQLFEPILISLAERVKFYVLFLLDRMYVLTYSIKMKDIRRTDVYIKWFRKLGDARAKARIYTRIERLAEGNPGDSRFLGEISEMRIDYGPGYRVYYKDTGREIIILLCGGDKTTQQSDIAKAKIIAKNYVLDEEEK